MSRRYLGGFITANPTIPTVSSASGAWTLSQQNQYANVWPFGGPFNYIEDVFSTWLYTGNGTSQTITNGIDLAGQGGLVWGKNRAANWDHYLADTAQGTGKFLSSNNTNSTSFDSTSVTAFNSNGFSIGNAGAFINNSGVNYCSWTFRKQPKFFDVVTYTGNGTSNFASQNISHNLGSVPGMIIIKATNTTSDWVIRHRSINSDSLLLNSTAASVNWLDTYTDGVTSTFFKAYKGSSTYPYSFNDNGVTYVAYLFAHNAGGFGLTGTDNVISCGSFTKTSNPDTITLGYEPQFVLVKNASQAEQWRLYDTMRGMPVTANSSEELNPNSAAAATSGVDGPKPTATGFTYSNGFAGDVYIYMAIRRGPMKTPTLGTSVFSPVAFNSNVFSGTVLGNACLTDLFFIANRSAGGFNTYSRLSPGELVPSSASAQGSAKYSFDLMDGVVATGTNYFATNLIRYHFRRAPGYFDVVCYTGTGSATTVAHNLGVAPELIIYKRRSATGNWLITGTVFANPTATYLTFTDSPATDYDNGWQTPTATTFGFNAGASDPGLNASGSTYVAYLFASVAGVSKVGSYTGNGTSQTINCGFTSGSRFVLIKATSTTGDWVVFDSARGIVAGNDPFLELNTTAAEQTGQDAVDTDNTGFVVNQTTESLNANGVTYIYLAIA